MSLDLTQPRVDALPPLVNVPLRTNASASQVKLYDRCARLWWLNYVASVRQKQLQHFILGTALHSVGERFLLGHARQEADLYPPKWNEGLTADESLWITKAVKHAIETGVWQLLTDAYVEFPLLFLTGEQHVDARGLPLLAAAKTYEDEQGVRRHTKPDTLIDGSEVPADWDATAPFVGFIDLLKLGKDPAIVDHKTSKNRRYATTAKKLAEDAQVLSYAALPMVLDPSLMNVRLRHNVFLKDQEVKIAHAVDADAPYQKVLEQWQHNRAVIQEMGSLRQHFPKVQGASPFGRAKNWLKVRSAIDEGRPSACDDYGGCPFREACTGRCSIESVVQRLDAPAPPGFVVMDDAARKPRTFGLNLAIIKLPPLPPLPPPKPPSKDQPMFTAPKITTGSDAYVIDPSNARQQYRCTITAGPDNTGMATIALWPDADIAPNLNTLGPIYLTDLPASALTGVPAITATITGYESELAKHPEVTAEQRAWQPQAPPTPVAGATTATIPKRDAPDGRFGLPGVAQALAPAIVAHAVPGKPAAKPVPPTPAVVANTSAVAAGTVLRVAATDHPFWSKLKGKLATVAFATPGEQPNQILYTVEIDAHPYPDVSSTRFELVPVSLPVAHEPEQTLSSRCMGLVGREVSVRFKVDGKDSVTTVNARLDSADLLNGITLLNGSLAIKYENVVSIELMTEAAIPGVKLPKGPGKVLENLDKDTAKAQDKLAKVQAKAAKESIAETVAADPVAPPMMLGAHLDTAIDLIAATLNGGKVTRKVLETIAPLLDKAKEYQMGLEAAAFVHSGPHDQTTNSGSGDENLKDVKSNLELASNMLLDAIAMIPV